MVYFLLSQKKFLSEKYSLYLLIREEINFYYVTGRSSDLFYFRRLPNLIGLVAL